MAEVIHANASTFAEVLKQNKVVLCDFWATWCGPCKMLGPVIEQLAAEYDGKAAVMKVDVDENQDLASQFQVMSIPTVYVFKDGQPVDNKVGAFPIDDYRAMLDAAL